MRRLMRANSARRSHRKRQSPNELLGPDDFDDVQYSVEVVQLAETSRNAAVEAANARMELLESAFVLVVGGVCLASAIAVGVVAMETTSSKVREAMWYLLPMLLLPVVWFAVLHLWEKKLLAPSLSSSASSSKSSSTRRPSKVAIF